MSPGDELIPYAKSPPPGFHLPFIWKTSGETRVRVLEVDPIQRRIVLAVTNIPDGQEKPAEPSKVIPMESDDYNMSDAIQVPIPVSYGVPEE